MIWKHNHTPSSALGGGLCICLPIKTVRWGISTRVFMSLFYQILGRVYIEGSKTKWIYVLLYSIAITTLSLLSLEISCICDLRQTLNINNANQTSVHYIQTVRSNHDTFFFKCLVFCLHYTLCIWIKSLNSIKM